MKLPMLLVLFFVSCGQSKSPSDQTVDNTITKTLFCSKKISERFVTIDYTVVQLKLLDTFVTGSVRSPAIEASKSAFYSSYQTAAASGPVTVTQDVVGDANGGTWIFQVGDGGPGVEYKDIDLEKKSETWTYSPDDCIMNEY